MAVSFSDSWEALGWAKSKAQEFDFTIKRAVENNSYTTFVERNTKLGGYDVKVRLTTPFPRDINRLAGEAIQQLRSALDYAVTAIIDPIDPKAAERVMFPIVGTEEAFENQLTRLKIPATSQKLADFLRGEKPYEAGNIDLFLLNELNRSGKHRRPIPTGTATVSARLQHAFGRHVIQLLFPPKGNPVDGITLVTLAAPPDEHNFSYDGQLAMHITFANVPQLAREPCVSVLWRYHRVVKEALERFSAAFS